MFKSLLISGFIFFLTFSTFGQSGQKRLSVTTITDKDLVVPEGIEKNFDQLLVDWKRNFKPSFDCSSDYNTNFSYPDSVYINRLYRLPTVMELAYNPIVRSYIDMYTGRMRTSVEYFLGKSKFYFPIIETFLDKYGLPLELKYLPIIESALNPTIVSRAGATGLWQFMIGTGKMYNLEINSLVDERRDPFRSSEAAARYLRDLYNIYGDWNLVIAAYNCGPGNVNKAIRLSNGQTDYWAIYPYLPRETRGYVPAFIAATYVMNYYSAHNICPSEYKYTSSIDTITVDKYLHLQQLADVLNIPIEQIRKLNPQFKKDIVPGEYKKYLVTLPSIGASEFEVQKDSVYTYRTNDFLTHRKVVIPEGENGNTNAKKIRHKVRRGESLGSIASRYKVTVQQMKNWNRLRSNKIRVGQFLAVYRTVAQPVQKETKPIESLGKENQNLKEENLASVKKEGNTSNNTILANYFSKQAAKNTTNIQNIEDEDDAPALNESQTIYHKVRIGETLQSIAEKYDVNKKDIRQWNKIKSTVLVGQRLAIHLPVKKEVEDNLLSDNAESPVHDETTVSVTEQNNDRTKTLVKEIKPAQNQKEIKKRISYYTVKRGDTLSQIASRFGNRATTKELMQVNKLRTSKLKIGQRLKIPN